MLRSLPLPLPLLALIACSAGCRGTGGTAGKVLVFDASDDGRTLAYASTYDHRVLLKKGDAAPIKTADGDSPTMLKDGGLVVVRYVPSEGGRLWRVAPDGSEKRLFEATGTNDSSPCASPNGGLTFVRSLATRPYSMGGTVQTDFVLMRAGEDGKLRRLTPKPFFHLTLQPGGDDGRHVYFVGDQTAADSEAVYRVAVSGSSPPEKLIRLSTLEGVTASADRDRIAFSDRDDAPHYSVKVARKDGRGVHVVSNEAAEEMRFIDGGRTLLILREPNLDGKYFLDTLDVESGRTLKRVRVQR